MTEQQAKNKIEEAGGDMEVFWDFMEGQTMGFKDGIIDIYDCDVDRFIRNYCDIEKQRTNI